MTGKRFMGFGGKALVRITGACPEDCIYRMTVEGIRFCDYHKEDVLTARFLVGLGDLNRVKVCAKKTMCQLETVKTLGLVPMLRAMGPRLFYLGVLAMLVPLVFWIQGHIFFFVVEGNTTIPTEEILRILEENGVGFWTSTDRLEINVLKNKILAEIPELSWITINSEGPVATVVVRQREEKPDTVRNAAPANVLAQKNGVIEAVITTGGTPQVKAGDVVTAGQLLISGVTNLDKTLLLSRAEGEVYARTYTRQKAVLEGVRQLKTYTGARITRFSITFGKNTINFYKTSGISYDNYDKMTIRNTLTLPGCYQLPLTVTVTTFQEYEVAESTLEETEAEQLLSHALRQDILSDLAAGEILSTRLYLEQVDGLYELSGIVECREEIGSTVEIKE